MWKGVLFGTATLVVLTHLLHDSLGLAQWTLVWPIVAGFLGLFLISQIDFAASFFAAMRFAEKLEQALGLLAGSALAWVGALLLSLLPNA